MPAVVSSTVGSLCGTSEELGKPCGRDAALGRPSMVAELGAAGAIQYFDRLVGGLVEAIPPCPGAASLRTLMQLEARRLLPDKLARRAA